MFIATVVMTLLVAAICAASAVGKLTKQAKIVASLTKVGVPDCWYPFLAGAELAGASGLLLGLLIIPALGVAAGTGLALYFAGAVISHVRIGDSDVAGAAVILVLALMSTILRVVTL